MYNCLMVGLGGFLGAAARYLLGLIPFQNITSFPIVTLLINFIGSFAIGVISQFSTDSGSADSPLTLFLKTGVCGGFTTFSTFALESGDMLQGGRGFMAALYIVLSLVLCISGAVLGRLAARRVV